MTKGHHEIKVSGEHACPWCDGTGLHAISLGASPNFVDCPGCDGSGDIRNTPDGSSTYVSVPGPGESLTMWTPKVRYGVPR